MELLENFGSLGLGCVFFLGVFCGNEPSLGVGIGGVGDPISFEDCFPGVANTLSSFIGVKRSVGFVVEPTQMPPI